VYRQRLYALIDKMHQATIKTWFPELKLAHDATRAEVLRLQEHWRQVFADQSDPIANFVIKDAYKFNTRTFMKKLKDVGFAVKFQWTPQMQSIFNDAVRENVELIRSIPEKYFGEIRKYVRELYSKEGSEGDLHTLTNKLESLPGMTRRRAAIIATDQNRKLTSQFNQARYQEIGINRAVWQHSGGGNEPRPTHVKNSGKVYDVSLGWFDPAVGQHIQPGQLPNCRCFSRPVIEL
jgi:uncharacterized protein with gpF-like domain